MTAGELIAAVAPSVGLAVLFAIVVRAMVQADRRERRAAERANRERADRDHRESA